MNHARGFAEIAADVFYAHSQAFHWHGRTFKLMPADRESITARIAEKIAPFIKDKAEENIGGGGKDA